MHEVFAALARQAAATPDRIAFEEEERSLTYGALAREVAALADALPAERHCVSLAGAGGLEWIVADLAVTLRGMRLVPLPVFFSGLQNAHICQDASVDLLLTCGAYSPASLPGGISSRPVRLGGTKGAPPLPAYQGGAQRIIYTSGTTGRPKGVLHGDRQLTQALRAIAAASGAAGEDRHLTALPYALLLEQIVGIFLPILLGGRAFVSPRAIIAALAGDCRDLLESYFQRRPSTTILTPQLLSAFVLLLQAKGAAAPQSLRLAALGGAPAAPALLAAGRALGFPLRQGYGLSEACSVVSFQREGEEDDNSVGRPLQGAGVSIEDGEIVVSGPVVMEGYLGRPPLSEARHRTGDLGFFDEAGLLHVTGRKDRVMVLSNGRNLSPEWLETSVLADPLFAAARAKGHGEERPRLLLQLRPQAFERLRGAPPETFKKRIEALLRDLPDHAQPGWVEIRLSEGGPTLLAFDLASERRAEGFTPIRMEAQATKP